MCRNFSELPPITSETNSLKSKNNKNEYCTFSEGCVSIHPAEEGIQKKSNKTQYLYRQLFHIERELSQLGPSSFQSPHSQSQALQQVQGMRSFLEDQLFKFTSANVDEPIHKKYRNHSLKRFTDESVCISLLTAYRNCVDFFLIFGGVLAH